jgi:uncharacterized membrane protein YjjP (DUF1212 family)
VSAYSGLLFALLAVSRKEEKYTMRWQTLSLAGLAGIVIGIVIQIIGGNTNFPTIPPGILFATLAIVTVLIVRPWWLVNVAWMIPAMLLVGGLVSDPGLIPLLTHPNNPTIRIGAFIVVLSYLVALPAGVMLTLDRWRSRNA